MKSLLLRVSAMMVLYGLVASAGAQGLAAGKYSIQTSRGFFFTAINGGGIAGRNAINTDATRVSGWEGFKLVPLGDGTYAIQTATGNYVTALNGGGIAGRVALHTDAKAVAGWEKFSLIDMRDGTYAIRTYNGRYVTALSGGGIGGGNIAHHTDATQPSGWEKFKFARLDAVACVPLPETWWYQVGSILAFWPYANGTWTSREIPYGDPNLREYWGSYKCVGANVWEFWNANGRLVRRVTLQADGSLFSPETNLVFRR